MAGATIDHMISLTILIAALLVAMMTYNGLFATAVDYDRNRQVANKAVDLMNTICLSPGNPTDWGETSDTLLGFGLQDPEAGGYALSPYSIMRLLPSESEILNYTKTGTLLQFSNVSMIQGGFLGVPIAECVNYTSVAELLGVNGSYGFRLNIVPTLSVSITEYMPNPLSLEVEVRGPGLALSNATLQYVLCSVYKPEDSDFPSFESRSGIEKTGPAGSKVLEFDPPLNGLEDTYSIIVYARLGGLVGVGYYSHGTIENDRIIPFIENFEQGEILLVHNWDVHEFPGSPSALHFNTTFFGLTNNFELTQFDITGETSGLINSGVSEQAYARLQINPSENGILFVSYRTGNTFGIMMLPWGVSTLGVSASFGVDPTGYDFVATELRQVSIDDISYHVKVSTWSLSG